MFPNPRPLVPTHAHTVPTQIFQAAHAVDLTRGTVLLLETIGNLAAPFLGLVGTRPRTATTAHNWFATRK